MKKELPKWIPWVLLVSLLCMGYTLVNGLRIAGLAGSGDVLAVDADGNVFKTNVVASGGGTNYPTPIRIGTNITVGSGVRKSLTLQTNASFAIVFTGTPINGEHISLGVSNIATSIIYMTNTAGIYDPSVASNVTTFAIAATSVRFFEFVSSTNFNLGVARWEVRDMLGKEVELAAAGSLVLLTNAAGSIITVSNSSASFDTNTDGSASFIGAGTGSVKLYDNAQTEFTGLEAPFDVQTNNVTRWLSNAVEGILILKGVGTGTNQATVIPLGTGMLTNNGSGVYGWMAIASGTGNVSSNNVGGITSIGTSTNKSTTWFEVDINGLGNIRAGAASQFYWNGRSQMSSVKDRTITFNSANTDSTVAGDFWGFFLGGQQMSNTLIRVRSSSIGTSNSIIEFRQGNTNGYNQVVAGSFWATNSIGLTNGALLVGPSAAAITNILAASATLDFPSTAAGLVSDLPITVTGCEDGDAVKLGVPSASIGPLASGGYMAWASNGVCYVRFCNNALVSAQDPASGVFKVIVTKF